MGNGKISSTFEDAKVVGAFINKGGFVAIIISLSIVIVILCAMLVKQRMDITNLWTRQDHLAWEETHNRHTDYIFASEKTDITRSFDKITFLIEKSNSDISDLSRKLAVLDANQSQILKKLEKMDGGNTENNTREKW
jgi:hypothetical protein